MNNEVQILIEIYVFKIYSWNKRKNGKLDHDKLEKSGGLDNNMLIYFNLFFLT